MLQKLDGFQYATLLDLNMGNYYIDLTLESQMFCTIVLPWSKYKYKKLPMGLCNSADISQEKMNELFTGLEYVRAYIDNLLVIIKGSFKDHLEKLDQVLNKLKNASLKIKASKSFSAQEELEYLGYWIPCKGILPVKIKFSDAEDSQT